MLGDFTEEVADHVGETVGGLLNASFGNAVGTSCSTRFSGLQLLDEKYEALYGDLTFAACCGSAEMVIGVQALMHNEIRVVQVSAPTMVTDTHTFGWKIRTPFGGKPNLLVSPILTCVQSV